AEDWGREEYVTSLLGGAFALRFVAGEVRLAAESGEAAWADAVGPAGPLHDVAASLGRDALAALRDRYVAYYERFRGPDGVTVPKPYVVVLGRRLEG
nr:methyltransferase type 11 [Actinomycetota bacterium]